MHSNISITSYMEKLEQELTKSIERREKIIERMPEGYIKCYPDRDWFSRYYISMEKDEDGKSVTTRRRINADEEKLAVKLALKGFHENALDTEQKQLRAVRMFLKNYVADMPGEKYLSKNAEYQRLASSALAKNSYTEQELEWMNKERPFSQPFSDELSVPCVMGYNVRSKSEAEYVAMFVKHKIVFRYEWPVKFEDYPYPVFPDFTLLNPKTGESILCEHYGRMDTEKYVRDNAEKMQLYFSHGYYPGLNLFMSYETKLKKFTSMDAENLIQNSLMPALQSNEESISKEAFWLYEIND